MRLARHVGLDPDRDGEKFREVGAALGKVGVNYYYQLWLGIPRRLVCRRGFTWYFHVFWQEFDDLYIGLVSTDVAPLFEGVEDLICDLARQKPVRPSFHVYASWRPVFAKENFAQGMNFILLLTYWLSPRHAGEFVKHTLAWRYSTLVLFSHTAFAVTISVARNLWHISRQGALSGAPRQAPCLYFQCLHTNTSVLYHDQRLDKYNSILGALSYFRTQAP